MGGTNPMNLEEEKEYFTNECKQYRILKKKINEYKYSIDRNQKLDKCILCEIGILKNRIKYVDDVLVMIDDPKVVKIIKDMWIDGKSKKRTSIDNEISESSMYYNINVSLHKVFQKKYHKI